MLRKVRQTNCAAATRLVYHRDRNVYQFLFYKELLNEASSRVAAASRRSADDDFNITRSLPGASGDCVVACDSDRNAAKRISENASAPVTHLTHDALRESVFVNLSSFISRTSPRIRAPACDRAAHRRRLRPEH